MNLPWSYRWWRFRRDVRRRMRRLFQDHLCAHQHTEPTVSWTGSGEICKRCLKTLNWKSWEKRP